MEAQLRDFKYERLLDEDPATASLTLLGTLPKTDSEEGDVHRLPAILRIQKTPLSPALASDFCSLLSKVQFVEKNDIYTWSFGWFGDARDKDVKINIIVPATEAHIRKYTKQEQVLVHETPALYECVVKPYIASFPPSRTQWVEDVLSGKTESHKVLYDDPSSSSGYVIVPDMKWDLTTVSTLYLLAIARSRDLHSIRDLRKTHLDMLRSIRRESTRVVNERWGLGEGSMRLFIHYQPSYYRFHVHIVNANLSGFLGMTVGQAHLLDDVISMLEVDTDFGPSIFERMTLTYGLGTQHALLERLIT